MALPHVVLSNDAKSDIDGIFAWIAEDSGVVRADTILRRLFAKVEDLAESPLIGRVRTDLESSPRSFAVWPWVIFYEPLANGRGIHVWRIIDGRRDIPRNIRRP